MESCNAPPPSASKPGFLGFGLGLRSQHYNDILTGNPAVDWFEIISENFMVPGGQPLQILDQICERYPVVMHGVSMSIASTAPLDFEYLKAVRTLAHRVRPKWISDHLCWTGVHGINLHDLLPIPYTYEALDHIAARVHKVQEVLGRPLTLENVSSYVAFAQQDMTEWEFLSELTRRTGCYLLFDVNNVYVSCMNHGWDIAAYLAPIGAELVGEIHLAGHAVQELEGFTLRIDDHGSPVAPAVWELYRLCIDRFGPVATLIEWDSNVPDFAQLMQEANLAERLLIPTAETLSHANPG